MNTETKKQAYSLKANYERNQASKRLEFVINRLQRTMFDLECCLEDLEAAEDDAKRAKALNAAINHLICNMQPELRIDLLAESQAELAKLGA